MEEDKKTKIEEPAPEEPTPEEPAPEEPANTPDYAEALTAVKIEYEKKINSLREELKGRIEERDKIIKQLLTGEKQTPTPTAIDKINQKRNYPKW